MTKHSLRFENTRLRRELDAMKIAANVPLDTHTAFGLPRTQNILFMLLIGREVVSVDAAMQVLYGAAPKDMPGEKVITVRISQLRKYLPAGVAIENRPGVGWSISRADKSRIRNLLNQGADHERPAPDRFRPASPSRPSAAA